MDGPPTWPIGNTPARVDEQLELVFPSPGRVLSTPQETLSRLAQKLCRFNGRTMRLAENKLQTKFAEEHSVRPPLLLTISPRTGADGLEFRTFRDLNELETLRSIWNSWPGARESDFDLFSSAVKSSAQPYVVLLSRNANPESILIGRRERKRMPFRLGYLTVCLREVEVIEFVHGGLGGNAAEEYAEDPAPEVMWLLKKGEVALAVR